MNKPYSDKEIEMLALINTIEATDNAISEVLNKHRVDQRMKQVLKASLKANKRFLREFHKHSNEEADDEVIGQGSLIYEISKKVSIVPDALILQYSKDLHEMSDAYSTAIIQHMSETKEILN